MRTLKKHLEKIYRKVALKLVKQGAGMPAKAVEPSTQDNPVSQEALHVSGAALSPSTLLGQAEEPKLACVCTLFLAAQRTLKPTISLWPLTRSSSWS